MKNLLKVKRSLISLSNKKNIKSFAKLLQKLNIQIVSTGNTSRVLKEANIKVNAIEKITKFPEILDGRVKTLHPNIYGGILANLDNKRHIKQINQLNIQQIQLIVVNLYPFEEVIKKTNSINKCIENIDIGGPSLIRAAAKNYISTAVVVDIDDYSIIKKDLEKYNGITLELRKYLAVKAFKHILSYDLEIFNWYDRNIGLNEEKNFLLSGEKIETLRYGENPHQSAEVYSQNNEKKNIFYEKLNGKSLSFNNLNDLRTALNLLSEFSNPSSVIIKHAIPCGVAEAHDIADAWKQSFFADSLSAFGGVVALNRTVDKKLANELSKIFLEVVAAKSFTREALSILRIKKNLRVIKIKNLRSFKNKKPKHIISISNIFLVQDSDNHHISKRDLKLVSKKKPSSKELEDLIFAYKVVKYVRSNAIVIAKNKTTIGIGSGNTSRVDSVNFALQKSERAKNTDKNDILNGAVMASDAFFPFSDSIILASNAGIKSIIQPGGSVKDKEVIEEVNRKKISMIFTDKRCFSH